MAKASVLSRGLSTPRDVLLRRKYGITEAQYERLLAEHDGGCWICSKLPKARRLAVDHHHKTGFVRGLLCWRCNQGLQVYGDDPLRLHSAAAYLEAA